jgi:DNA-binding transcriptional MerR regulator
MVCDGNVNEHDGALRIGEVAGLAGVSTKAVRLYERHGLLAPPARSAAGYRRYTAADVIRLMRVSRLRALGLGLSQLRDVLGPAGPVSIDEALAEMRADVDRRVVTLQALGDALDAARSSPALARAESMWTALLEHAPTEPWAAPDDVEQFVPEAVCARLATLATRSDWTLTANRLRSLRDADWDDPRVADVAAAVASVLPVDLLPDELSGPAAFALLVGRRVSAAQVRCLLLAGRRARGQE